KGRREIGVHPRRPFGACWFNEAVGSVGLRPRLFACAPSGLLLFGRLAVSKLLQLRNLKAGRSPREWGVPRCCLLLTTQSYHRPVPNHHGTPIAITSHKAESPSGRGPG